MRAAAISFVTALLISGTAFAQDAEPADADTAAFSGEDGGVAVYDFEDDNVDGEVLRPEGANLSSRRSLKHASLINIRPHFLRELINLARDV